MPRARAYKGLEGRGPAMTASAVARAALAATVAFSVAAVLLWYLWCPLSPGPPAWIRSTNRDLIESSYWNWGHTYRSAPSDVHTPRSIEELREVVLRAKRVRVVGGGHSFSPLARTRHTLVDLRRIDKVAFDPATNRVVVGGGAKIRALQHKLLRHGRVVHGFGGGTHHQSVAGALSTNLHGAQNCLFADYIVGADVMYADGSVKAATPADLAAVKSGMGAVGVVVAVTLSTHPRTCLRTKAARISLEAAHNTLYDSGLAAAEFKTTGHGIAAGLDGVFTAYVASGNACDIDYPLNNYRDMAAAYTHDNWVAPVQVLMMPLMGSTRAFHALVTGAMHAATDNVVVGVENGWRGTVAPLYGEVFTEYAVPRANCTAAMRAVADAAREHGVLVTAMTIKPLPAEEGTHLAYAPVQSCAAEIYYMPCQKGLRAHILRAQDIIHSTGGRSHLGKTYFEDTRPIHHRANMGGARAYEAHVAAADPAGKFTLEPFEYAVDYSDLHTRATLFRVTVWLAAAAGITAIAAAVVAARCAPKGYALVHGKM